MTGVVGDNVAVGCPSQTIRANQGWFTNTTVIMNNNSKWLADDRPCLTYGLRGRLCCDVEVRDPP